MSSSSGSGDPSAGAAAAAPVVVDARGLRCPIPVIRAARAAQELAPGNRIEVLSTDPAAATDLPAWSRMRGHVVELLERDGDDVQVVIRLV